MLLFEQLDFAFRFSINCPLGRDAGSGSWKRVASRKPRRDQTRARECAWNGMPVCAAPPAAPNFAHALVSLNPRLREHRRARKLIAPCDMNSRIYSRKRARVADASHRTARNGDAPVAISASRDEKRCHTLPFPASMRARRYLYRCPRCEDDFPRVRRIRRAMACLACCRKHNRGQFDRRFQLELIRADSA